MKIVLAIISSVGMIAVAVVAFFGITVYQTQVKNQAIDACFQAGRVTFRQIDENGNESQRSDLPATDTFKECLKAKNVSV